LCQVGRIFGPVRRIGISIKSSSAMNKFLVNILTILLISYFLTNPLETSSFSSPSKIDQNYLFTAQAFQTRGLFELQSPKPEGPAVFELLATETHLSASTLERLRLMELLGIKPEHWKQSIISPRDRRLLRDSLYSEPPGSPLWVEAYQFVEMYYPFADLQRLQSVETLEEARLHGVARYAARLTLEALFDTLTQTHLEAIFRAETTRRGFFSGALALLLCKWLGISMTQETKPMIDLAVPLIIGNEPGISGLHDALRPVSFTKNSFFFGTTPGSVRLPDRGTDYSLELMRTSFGRRQVIIDHGRIVYFDDISEGDPYRSDYIVLTKDEKLFAGVSNKVQNIVLSNLQKWEERIDHVILNQALRRAGILNIISDLIEQCLQTLWNQDPPEYGVRHRDLRVGWEMGVILPFHLLPDSLKSRLQERGIPDAWKYLYQLYAQADNLLRPGIPGAFDVIGLKGRLQPLATKVAELTFADRRNFLSQGYRKDFGFDKTKHSKPVSSKLARLVAQSILDFDRPLQEWATQVIECLHPLDNNDHRSANNSLVFLSRLYLLSFKPMAKDVVSGQHRLTQAQLDGWVKWLEYFIGQHDYLSNDLKMDLNSVWKECAERIVSLWPSADGSYVEEKGSAESLPDNQLLRALAQRLVQNAIMNTLDPKAISAVLEDSVFQLLRTSLEEAGFNLQMVEDHIVSVHDKRDSMRSNAA